jgi:hypothetical protein
VRKIKEVLLLKFEVGLGLRQIARSCSIGLGTAHEYLQRAEAAKIRWPLGPEDDDRLEAALFGGPPRSRPTVLPMPDFAELHRQRQQHPHLTQHCCGRSTGEPTRTAIATPDSANCTSAGAASRMWTRFHRCGSCADTSREEHQRSVEPLRRGRVVLLYGETDSRDAEGTERRGTRLHRARAKTQHAVGRRTSTLETGG